MPNDDAHSVLVDTSSAATTAPRNKWLSALVVLVRILVGATFILSGVVKLIDPVGTMYKIEDYLQVFNLSLFNSWSYVLAVLLSMAEFVLGVNALLGSYLRTTPILLLIFMAIMTPLTLFLAIANPIPDCGCFGDFITLANWQTFGKNVLLLALVIFLFRYNRRARSVFHREVHAFIVVWVVVYALALVYIAAVYSPILDFRPFKPGTNLASAYFGDDIQVTEYDFVYEREGMQATFSIDSLPDETDGWQFIERRERAGGVQQPEENELLNSFIVYDGNEDVTEEILSHEGYVFVLFSEDLTKANDNEINKVHELYDYTREYGYPFYAITASTPSEIDNWQDDTGVEFPFFYMDRNTIRIIQRSNPFLMVLNDGVIYHKHYIENTPSEALLSVPVEEIPAYAQPEIYKANPRIMALVILLVLPILLLYFTERIALFALRRFRRWREQRKEMQKIED
jgi:uncharacterized membrane protein YphA (DoxX/SURF4 family)